MPLPSSFTRRIALLGLLPWLTSAAALAAVPFRFPTDNRALLEEGGERRFFAPTPGRSWTAGQFGCVRSEGTQLHEGIDILATRRDRSGEPLDEVRASATGQVAYVNRRPALSNYGNYIVLRHRVDGFEVFTLYAHLAECRTGLKAGRPITAGETIGRMGRTTNTLTPIARDRAHLHFEIGLLVNERFSSWLKEHAPGMRDDHGPWNGRNLAGLDPGEILRLQAARGERFRFGDFVRSRPALCRVLVPSASFPWLRRYPGLVKRPPRTARDAVVAHEVTLDFSGVPIQLTPRKRTEVQGPLTLRVLEVNETQQRRNPCRKLVFKRGQSWILTATGRDLISLLTY